MVEDDAGFFELAPEEKRPFDAMAAEMRALLPDVLLLGESVFDECGLGLLFGANVREAAQRVSRARRDASSTGGLREAEALLDAGIRSDMLARARERFTADVGELDTLPELRDLLLDLWR